RHAWQVSARWRPDDREPAGGVWVAAIEPGFVNGRDVLLHDDERGEAFPLTDDVPPEIAIRGWRDPAQPGGAVATADLELIVESAEGYPPFFDTIGVTPAARGGKGFAALEGASDPDRTRQIRAVDVVLITPRIAARQQVDVLNPFTDQQAVQISTAFSDAALQRNARHRIGIFGQQWTPPHAATPAEKLSGAAAEPELDELLLATLYVVSPPAAGDDAKPDASWTAYPRHRVFWNLAHAARNETPKTAFTPITFFLPLAGGLAQPIISAILTPLNDAASLVYALLDSADFTGRYWAPSGTGYETLARPKSQAAPVKTGVDPRAQRAARESAAAVAAAPPPLNPSFPFLKAPQFDPFFFGLERDPPPRSFDTTPRS
ncbi:MAG: hypothetical protein ABMA13_23950, partial [Chthoniobacteraceae bacterium]